MRIFLSYASERRPLAQRIQETLEGEGHKVFFDRDSLPAGETYDRRIREAIRDCQIFVLLVSPEAFDSGSYTRTEVALLEELVEHEHSAPALLPVLVAPIDFAALPAFLAARTIYQPSGNVPAEVAAQVDLIARRAERPAPLLIGMPSNQGWMLYLDLAGEQPKEIFFRLREDQPWSSTGFAPARSFSTGKPLARADLPLVTRQPPTEVFVKYVDDNGREHGPYRVPFDAREQFVRITKETLRTTSWLHFREWDGRLLVYFTALLTYKDAFTALRYSIDDESLGKQVRFTSEPGRLALASTADDETYVAAPLTTQFVRVRVELVDETADERTYTVAEAGVER